jgi:rhamnose utilization protein RhaD (predicted bifunctional aldolase and dehydrogenase)/NAD(P)-dependent dehydrogenase (short-subunit alcohol dehydrogenase family)
MTEDKKKYRSLEMLAKLSRHYGANPEFVVAGGGNTSVKIGNSLFIKASGIALADITPDGFVEMDRSALLDILYKECPENPDEREMMFKTATLTARVHPEKGQRPSVECILHNLMPGKFVVHTHSTYANMLTCSTNGEKIARELFGDRVLWAPYVDPGFMLALSLRKLLTEYQERTGREVPDALLMKNHGLIIAGDTPDEIYKRTNSVLMPIRRKLTKARKKYPFGKIKHIDSQDARRLFEIIAPSLRALLSDSDELSIVSFDDSDIAIEFSCGAKGVEVANGGPLTPDQIVYCKSLPLWFKPSGFEEDKIVRQLKESVASYRNKTGYLPKVILVEGLGLFASGESYSIADSTSAVYDAAIKVMAGAIAFGGINYMSRGDAEFIEHWEVESYRRSISAGNQNKGRVCGKVALVTGAAQGFGLEIAQNLAKQGAHVVLGDINAEGAQSAAEAICRIYGKRRATGVEMNVVNPKSVSDAIHQTVRTYGGLDILISNAGVLKAESVKTQPEGDFDLVTSVNYRGYFVCVKYAAPVMAIPHMLKTDYWSDIIQINSKSGLVGSNRNGAYAGAKFGGIGLTQSFALELIEDGIKVNAICPGNFLDGPLWSDAKNGLFVQYLRAGKIPGAKTIADIRRAYEAKVPMGRGCATTDVMKAIYYIIEQKYETGQAIPVTGGQVMLG